MSTRKREHAQIATARAFTHLVDGDDEWLVDEERSDLVKEGDLLRERVAALLGDVEHVEDAALQVGERRDRLHLDRVALLERLVEHAGRVKHLRSVRGSESGLHSDKRQTSVEIGGWGIATSPGNVICINTSCKYRNTRRGSFPGGNAQSRG
eukprot:178321-Pleurochrysis_carterae.AAC.1